MSVYMYQLFLISLWTCNMQIYPLHFQTNYMWNSYINFLFKNNLISQYVLFLTSLNGSAVFLYCYYRLIAVSCVGDYFKSSDILSLGVQRWKKKKVALLVGLVLCVSFSALTLLVGLQAAYVACKNNLSHLLPKALSTGRKTGEGNDYQGSPGKWPLVWGVRLLPRSRPAAKQHKQQQRKTDRKSVL